MFVRNLVFLIVILALIVGVVGFYLDWFHLSTGGGEHHANVNFSVDKERIKQDEEKAKQAVQDLGNKIRGRQEEDVARSHDAGTAIRTFEADMENRLKGFDAKVGDLQARIARAEAPKKAELSRDMEQLNQKRREVNRKLQELKTATGKVADDLKAEIETDLKELHKEYERIAAQF
jgi:hypothetical protein